MLDAKHRRVINPPLNRIGAQFAHWGIGADAVTIAGFGIDVAAWVALAVQAYAIALLLVLLNRLCNGLDGAVARHGGVTDRGGYLDIVLDFIFYARVPFFFAIGRPEAALPPAAFLIFSFMGMASSFWPLRFSPPNGGLRPRREDTDPSTISAC